VSLVYLRKRRVSDEPPLDTDHANGNHWSIPWNIRNVQRGTGSDDRKHIRRIVLVAAHHGRNDLGVLPVTLREQGPQWAVHQATGQRFEVPESPLSLEEATRNAPCCVRLFDVLTSHGKEVQTRAFGRRDDRYQ